MASVSRTPSFRAPIPIITDSILVDPKFGTGAVKVTPAHDFNDFATGKRHGLEVVSIMNPTARSTRTEVRFAGQDRKEARKAVKRKLESWGSLVARSLTCSFFRDAIAVAPSSSR